MAKALTQINSSQFSDERQLAVNQAALDWACLSTHTLPVTHGAVSLTPFTPLAHSSPLSPMRFSYTCVCVWICAQECSTHRGQMRAPEPLGLELQANVSHCCGCWDLNSDLDEEYVHSIAEPISPAPQDPPFMFIFQQY